MAPDKEAELRVNRKENDCGYNSPEGKGWHIAGKQTSLNLSRGTGESQSKFDTCGLLGSPYQ